MAFAALAFTVQAVAALPTAAAEKSAEAHIAFANAGGIDDWRALDDKGLYVRGPHRQWYYATLFSSCFGLSTANSVAFITSPGGSFDKFSTIIADGSRCPVVSVVKSEPPPKKDGSKKTGAK